MDSPIEALNDLLPADIYAFFFIPRAASDDGVYSTVSAPTSPLSTPTREHDPNHKLHDFASASSSQESTLVETPPSTAEDRPIPRRARSEYFERHHHGILRYETTPPPSTPMTPGIKFAPLPAISDRKRKTSGTLGVAARSRMLAQRRAQRLQQIEDDKPPESLWSNKEKKEKTKEKSSSNAGAEEEDDEVFAAFGQFARRAGKGLWRKVSTKDVKKRGKDDPSSSESPPPVPPLPEGVVERATDRSPPPSIPSQGFEDDNPEFTQTIRPENDYEEHEADPVEPEYQNTGGTVNVTPEPAEQTPILDQQPIVISPISVVAPTAIAAAPISPPLPESPKPGSQRRSSVAGPRGPRGPLPIPPVAPVR